MRLINWVLCVVVGSKLAAAAADIVLEPTKPTAPRIVREAVTNQPLHDFRLDGKLILAGTDGTKKTLGVVILTKPTETSTDTIFRIVEPVEVSGAALMVLQSADHPNQIFFRGPGEAEAVEITGERNREHFLDTDLSYEDVNFSFLRWISQETLREEKRLGRWCDVIKSIPAREDHSQYASVLSWIDKETHALLVAEGYDVEGHLLKSFIVKGFLRSGGGWTVKEMVVEDQSTGHKTRLVIEKGDFKIDHPEGLFTRKEFFRDLPSDPNH